MHYVYILKSFKHNRLYVGLTCEVKRRLTEHNRGCVRSTKAYRPYVLVHSESFDSKTEAIQREKYFKYTPDGGILKKKLAVIGEGKHK